MVESGEVTPRDWGYRVSYHQHLGLGSRRTGHD